MTIWLVMALLTGAAVLAVLWPLSRERARVTEADRSTDAAFYRARLAELEQDSERGLIDPADAEAARLEAARLLLAADRRVAAGKAVASSSTRRRIAAVLALVGIPALSLGLYLAIGHPDMPGQPLASRTQKPVGTDISMQDALDRIEKHLAENPGDGRGFEVVAPVYLSMGRYDDAVRAWASAVRLLGETPARLENWGEAQVAAADGVVTADARAAFDKVLAAEPKRVKARFYKGVAAEQDGDKAAAIGLYSEVSRDAGSPQLSANLEQRIAALGGTPPSRQGPGPGPATTDPMQSEAGKAVAAMPAEDRMATIRSMVDGLAQRLDKDGSDVDGWLKLVRSYAVLQEPDKARAALDRGRAALAADTAGRDRLDALARDLNLGGS